MHKRVRPLLLTLLSILILLSALPAAFAMEVPGELTRPGLPFLADYPAPAPIPGQNPVTGLPQADIPYTPVMQVLDNAPAAYPHWGVKEADLFYQVPNAGAGGTKLLALFVGSFPERAGGSRSARPPFVNVAREWGAALVYAGHNNLPKGDMANVQDYLTQAGMRQRVKAFNLLHNNNYSERERGYGSPHNLSVHIRTIRDLAVENGAVFPTPRPFLFTDSLPESGVPAREFTVAHYGETRGSGKGNEPSFSRFVYQPELNAYWREHSRGWDADRDERETQLAFANVIIQRVKFSHHNAYVLINDFEGTGAADIFTGGRYIRGGWFKQDLDSRTVFVDENGQEIALQRGKTFIILTNDITTATITGQ